MDKLLIFLLGLIALLILTFFCINRHGPEIEDDLVSRTQRALNEDNNGFADVATDGRELVLTGIAPNEAAREKALEIARGIRGVRSVDNQLTLAQVAPVAQEPSASTEPEPVPYYEVKQQQPLDGPPAAAFPVAPSPYQTDIVYDNGKVVLSGLVADEAARLWLVTKAKELFGSENVDDQLKVAYGAPQGWHTTVEAALGYLGALDHGKASLVDQVLSITGFASSERVVDQVKGGISDAMSTNYTSIFDIIAEEPEPIPAFEVKGPEPLDSSPATRMSPVPAEYHTEIIYKNGMITLSGDVPDQAARVWLVSLAEEKYGKGKVIDRMTTVYGAPQGWHASIGAAVVNLLSLEEGKATLINTNLTVSGQATSNAIKSQVEQAIGKNIVNFTDSYDITVPELKPEISCQQKFDDLLKNQRILFDTDKAIIKSESYLLLDKIIAVTRECPKAEIEIAGHTDDRGLRAHNQELSEKRAQAVVNYLKQHGVTSNKLKAIGYGELKPIADNKTPEGMAKNRRIEFNVQGN